MTRWLQAAKQIAESVTVAAHDDRPALSCTPGHRVLSVLSVSSEAEGADPAPPARDDALDPDAGAYLDRLHLYGPATYGAMASAMGWGATRAWRAEATLRALGLVLMSDFGRAVATETT
jgi:hypothetical protein